MRGWLIAAALMMPMAALAQGAAPKAAGRAAPAYVVLPPPPMIDKSTGWSWRASVGEKSLDLEAPSGGWWDGGAQGPRDVVAGYVWREEGQSMVFGYDRHTYDAQPFDRSARLFNPRPWRDDPDVLGLTLRFQTGR
jgi:hypothetical protein